MQLKKIKISKLYLLIIMIVLVSLLGGILYYSFLDNNTKLNIINTLNNYKEFNSNKFIIDFVIMSTILVSSFLGAGILLGVLYLIYESFTIGFLINCFLTIYKIKGLYYILTYILLERVLPLFFIMLFVNKAIRISIYLFEYLIHKNHSSMAKIINNFKNGIYIMIFVLIINLVFYFAF